MNAITTTSVIFTTVNLPIPVFLHALGCCFLGLRLIFTTPMPPRPPVQDRTILGIVTLAIGLAYLSTSYMPPEKNAFLYASAPVRIVLAGIASAKLAMGHFSEDNVENREARGSDVRDRSGLLWGIVLYDGLGGIILGWWLGTFCGRIPAYQALA